MYLWNTICNLGTICKQINDTIGNQTQYFYRHIFVVFFQTVAYKMLATTVVLILLRVSVTSAQELCCKTIMTSFYQTEDQYYDLGCDRTDDNSDKALLYRCGFLQKKMDITGRQYYDLGVSFI